MIRTGILALLGLAFATLSTSDVRAQPPSFDYFWQQDTNHTYHYASAIARISIDDQGYQQEDGSGHEMARDDDEEDLFNGNQAAAGAATSYTGSGIIGAIADSEANAWTTGDNTQDIYALWTCAGSGSVDNGTLPDYQDINDEFSWACNFGMAMHDDWWRLHRTTQSTGTTNAVGYLDLAGIPAQANPWYGIDVEVQLGTNLDGNGEPQTWTTIFYATGRTASTNLSVGWYQWDEDLYGPYLAWYEDEFDVVDATYEFAFQASAGDVLRIVQNTDYAQDVGADDNASSSGSHELTATLAVSVIDP